MAKANPRGIITQFFSYKKRQEFIMNKKKLKGTKFSICDDLIPTRYILYNYSLSERMKVLNLSV